MFGDEISSSLTLCALWSYGVGRRGGLRSGNRGKDGISTSGSLQGRRVSHVTRTLVTDLDLVSYFYKFIQ